MSTAPIPPLASARTGTEATRAQALRVHIESTLGDRFSGALTPAPRPLRETVPSGIEPLDVMLGGGVPLGAITELVGPLSSGRTGIAMSTVAAAMREGNMCAWVDASDAFDPESAAANGVCLEQLLWVRCGVALAAGVPVSTGQGSSIGQPPGGSRARAGQHPRDEVRGLDTAVGDLLREGSCGRDRSVVKPGTPGAPNRVLSRTPQAAAGAGGVIKNPRCVPQDKNHERVDERMERPFGPVKREEQVSSDRQPKRGREGMKTEAIAAFSKNHEPGAPPRVTSFAQNQVEFAASGLTPTKLNKGAAGKAKPWSRLDQALRAADLLLHMGGFRVLVLDLGSIAPEHALRIPLATWFRFRAAAEANRTVLLALTQTSCARSSAGLVVNLSAIEAQTVPAALVATHPCETLHLVEAGLKNEAFREKPQPRACPAKLIEGIRYHAQPMRQRFTPCSPQSAEHDHAVSRSPRRPAQATWQLEAYPLREQA